MEPDIEYLDTTEKRIEFFREKGIEISPAMTQALKRENELGYLQGKQDGLKESI